MHMDLRGEERFGPVTSRLYNLFAIVGAFGAYDFIAKDLIAGNGTFTLLDVGTGPGILPEILAVKTDRIKIYAVDPSPAMLKIARKKRGNAKVKFALGYSQMVPFNMKFDMIVSSISFHHWAHKKESLQYLSRFLKPNGEIRIYELKKSGRFYDYFVDMHRMSVKELRNSVNGTGLKVKSIVVKDRFVRATYVKNK